MSRRLPTFAFPAIHLVLRVSAEPAAADRRQMSRSQIHLSVGRVGLAGRIIAPADESATAHLNNLGENEMRSRRMTRSLTRR